MDRLLTTAEVADRLHVAAETVRFWRHTGTGPVARKVGRHVRYRSVDVEDWLDRQPVRGGGSSSWPVGAA